VGLREGVVTPLAALTFRSWLPVPAAVALGALAAFAVVLLYRAEGGRVPRWRRLPLAGLRALTLAGVLFLALRPTLVTESDRQQPRPVAVLVDDSQSMTTADPRPNTADRWRVAVALDRVPPDRPMPGPSDLPDVPAKPTRLELVKAVLTNPRLKLLEELAKVGPVRPEAVGAGRSPRDPSTADWVNALEGKEPRTALADALAELARRDEADRPAAVVLLTDGRDAGSRTTLAAAAAECRRAGLPVHAYCAGAAGGGRAEVLDVAVADTLFVDDTAAVGVRFVGRGLTGPAELVAGLNGREVARTAVELTDQPQRETLTFAPTTADVQPGRLPLTITLKATGPEPAEDRSIKPVRVSDRKLKVLVCDALPRWDFKFLQRLLLRDRRVEASFWLTDADRRATTAAPFVQRFPPDRAGLFAHDLVVWGDLSPSALTADQQQHVRDFVVEGGGLIVAAGRRHTPRGFVGTPLADLLPVEPTAEVVGDDAYRPAPTPSGGRSPTLSLADTPAASLAAWKDLPPMTWAAPVGRLRPAAEALLVHPDRTADGKPMPVLATHFYGKGTVLFVGFEEAWRWRLNAADKYFGRLWGQMVYAAGVPKALGSKLAQLALDPAEPTLGQVGRVYARLFTPDLLPLAADAVEAKLTNLDGPPAPAAVVFRPVPGQPGEFVATLPFTTEGRFALSLDAGAEAVSLDYRVSLPPDHELAPGGPADGELRQLADVTGGGFYREEDLHTLPGKLKPAATAVTVREEFLLWNRWAFLAVFGLLALEWVARRLSSLS
jgi:hypothetical protein